MREWARELGALEKRKRDAFLTFERGRGLASDDYVTRTDIRDAGEWRQVRDAASAQPPVDFSSFEIDDDVTEETTEGVIEQVRDAVHHRVEEFSYQGKPLPDMGPERPWGTVPTRERLLIIPDAHAHPDYDNLRFDHIGAYINRRQPEHILCLGDFWCMPSLSSYDRGKRSAENKRAQRDIDAGRDAMDRVCNFGYSPKSMTFTMGNHEERLDRIGQDHPELSGIVGTESLKVADWGWTVAPFKVPVEVCGFSACHYFVSGVMGRPIGGKNSAGRILGEEHCSTISAHSHVYDTKISKTTSGRRPLSIVAGCITHPNDMAGWSTPQARMWRRCLTVVHNVKAGFGDVEQIGLDRLASA